MRRSNIACAAVVAISLGFGGSVFADIQSDIQLTRAEIQTERQAIVTANLGLTEDEALAFWPMYRDYRLEMARVGDRLVKLITRYAESWEALTDAAADEMLAESMAIQAEEGVIRKKWSPKFRKVLPARKNARFFQIENKLDALIRAELAAAIPLVPAAPKK